MKIGVYVGSFNPVHKGHIRIVNHLIKNKYVDRIIIIPTEAYWNKNNLIDLTHRINMLKFYENKDIIINQQLNNYKYTYQILSKLNKDYKDDEIYLIIGADNIIDFHKWKNYKDILNYNLIIIARDNINIEFYLNKLNKYDKYQIINDLPSMNISSTMIRNLKTNKKYEELPKYLDSKILEYIINHALY